MRWDFWVASIWQAARPPRFPGLRIKADLKQRCWRAHPLLQPLLKGSPELQSETRSCGSGAGEWLEFPARSEQPSLPSVEACAGRSQVRVRCLLHPGLGGWGWTGAAENSRYVLPAPGMMLWPRYFPVPGLLAGAFQPRFSFPVAWRYLIAWLPPSRRYKWMLTPTSATGWGFLGRFPTSITAQAWGKVSFCCSSPAASRCGGCSGAGAACPVCPALPRVTLR